jgi:G3E family GTPase
LPNLFFWLLSAVAVNCNCWLAVLLCNFVSAVQQVAFADRLLLNKTDLVSEAEKAAVIKRLRVRVQLVIAAALHAAISLIRVVGY